jgi:hypothetical protein
LIYYAHVVTCHDNLSHRPQSSFHLNKFNSGFVQYPRLYFDVPHMQQVEFPLYVVLFSNGAWLVPHYLSNDTGRHFHPLRQCAKGTA